MRLIDADAIELHEQLEPVDEGRYVSVRVAYMDDIDALPTAEPEKKTGKWEENNNIGTFKDFTCSECGWDSEGAFNFCPNCGAEMKKENIQVGYMVMYVESDGTMIYGVVMDALTYDQYVLFSENGFIEYHQGKNISKTGKHLDVVDILLKKLQEEE